jgi:hypothetical protein
VGQANISAAQERKDEEFCRVTCDAVHGYLDSQQDLDSFSSNICANAFLNSWGKATAAA